MTENSTENARSVPVGHIRHEPQGDMETAESGLVVDWCGCCSLMVGDSTSDRPVRISAADGGKLLIQKVAAVRYYDTEDGQFWRSISDPDSEHPDNIFRKQIRVLCDSQGELLLDSSNNPIPLNR